MVARRLVILASEDIGLEPIPMRYYLLIPPCEAYRASVCLKRGLFWGKWWCIWRHRRVNSSYRAINKTMRLAENDQSPVPLHLRNGVTKLMRAEGYGANYISA